MESVKWFDLSRYGIALRVVPASPLRGVAMTCLEVRDSALFNTMFGWKQEGITENERSNLREKFRQAKEELGFNGDTQSVLIDDESVEGGFRRYLRLFSAKTQFSLSELRQLCPGLDASDLREMPKDEIRLVAEPKAGKDGEWAKFVETVLAPANHGVWTPVVNPYDKSFAESGKIHEAYPSSQKHVLFNGNTLASRIATLLDEGKYRLNALIPFYADLESAVTDGWRREDLQQVDLPYAAPIWLSEVGKIIALKDVRFAPEVINFSPEHLYGEGGARAKIASALREAKQLPQLIGGAVDQLKAWGESPEKLNEPDLLWGRISEIVTGIGEYGQRYPIVSHAAFYDLMDNEKYKHNKAIRLKPLGEMNDRDVDYIAMMVGKFAQLDAGEKCEFSGLLKTALKRGHELMAETVKTIAGQQLRELASKVQAEAAEPAEFKESKVKHVDTGEKIGGARKDYARRSMVVEDLDDMNDLERKALVVKKNVWPPLDYPQMREDGVTPQAAIAIKCLKDSLAVEPDREHDMINHDPEGEYIKAISAVRDATATIKTLDDFKEACFKLFNDGQPEKKGEGRYIWGYTPFQVAVGRKAATLLADSSRRSHWDETRETKMPYDVQKAISKAVYRHGHKDEVTWQRVATDDQLWGALIKPQKVKSEAEKEAAAEEGKLERELHRPHLDRVQRSGEDWRSGRDIVADDLIEHFGFRAVEFGNWLPQDERQQVLNMAFDSLCDLADALDIPPKGVSFDGELALAFGSRGSGGKNAALAHFEPNRFVINMTRINGAGALAHEWMHAFDRHLGGRTKYASETKKTDTAMGALASRLVSVPMSVDAIYDEASRKALQGAKSAPTWLTHGKSDAERQHIKDVMNALYESSKNTFTEEATRKLKAGLDNDSTFASNIPHKGYQENWYSVQTRVMDELLVACGKKPLKKDREGMESNIRYMLHYLPTVCTIDAARALNIESALQESFCADNIGKSDFKKAAEELDKTRSKPYWATSVELFARAGACYVYDKLAAKDVRSDYLVYGADEHRYDNHPLGNPNTAGEDRRVLAGHFDTLVAEYRLRCVSRAEADAAVEP